MEVSGNIAIAADITHAAGGFRDYKPMLVIRPTLDDDLKDALVKINGDGMIHLAQRAEQGKRITDVEYRIDGRGGVAGGTSPEVS